MKASSTNLIILLYVDKIQQLKEQLEEIKFEKCEIEKIIKEEHDYKLNRVKQENHEVIRELTETINFKNYHAKELSDNLQKLLEQLYCSEYYIQKMLKSLKHQDDVYLSAIEMHQKSEEMLKLYYHQKLVLWLDQIRLREKPIGVAVSTQTEDEYTSVSDELLVDNKQLEYTKQSKLKFEMLYRRSFKGLQDAMLDCSRLETKVKSLKQYVLPFSYKFRQKKDTMHNVQVHLADIEESQSKL